MHSRTPLAALLLSALLPAALALATPLKVAADSAKVGATLTPDGGRIVVEATGVPPAVPLFFSATADQTVRLGTAEIAGEIKLRLHLVQGKPEVLTLGLAGDGDVTEVAGKGLRDWAVRRGSNGERFLDLRPSEATPALAAGADLDLVVRTRLLKPAVPGATTLLVLTPGDAVGFAAQIALQPDAALDLRIATAEGTTPVGPALEPRQFVATGRCRIVAQLLQRGAALADVELVGAQLSAKVNEAAGNAEFRLRGQVRIQKAGARLRILAGNAAFNDRTVGDGWHVELRTVEEDEYAYELVGDRLGVFPLELAFAATVLEDGDWRKFNFAMPAGTVVPLAIEGLAAEANFKPDAPIVPVAAGAAWQGFLPADGAVALAWNRTRKADEGALFFTSSEQTDVRLGAGVLRQTAEIVFRVLQGKLGGVRCRLSGPGEILGVEGANVVGWKVLPDAAGRVLEVRFSRPVESAGTLTIRSQAELGAFPVRAEPLRLTPEGGVRHSGFVRVANSGAVRLEVADLAGMMQLAPAQFPGAAPEKETRQVLVYRFPAADYTYRVLASQIQPEIGVSALTTYQLADTDRILNASLELDVREAPLRDWTLHIPADFTVVAVTGTDIADYLAETQAADGYRALKVLFRRPIDGRQLVQLRLEKNQPAAAGDWQLPPLRFPGAKSVRGHIGAVATPGYRLTPIQVDQLVEVPLSYFPQQTAGLQQAWRLREPDWTAALRIEALGQSVQADVFHLYTLKEAVVYGSVLLNYFVVGAPATEWRIQVPATAGNIDVVGQNVRRDWRREGDQVIVALHQPVLGAATLLLTFEQPMSARGGTLQPGQVRPLNVQTERGFVEVVSPLQVKHQLLKAEGGLLKLEPLELPAELRLLSSSPALAVYQYTARPFALELGVEWYAPGETVDQVVDFAKLSSQVARDGQVVTEVRYFVKTRGRKALRLQLPAGVQLWEARVDNEVVTARADGPQTLVPLPARLNPNDPAAVTLRLGQPATGSGATVKLVAPRMLAPTVINEWTVRGDSGRQLAPLGGNAELVRPALTETGFEWIARHGQLPTFFLLGCTLLGGFLLRTQLAWRRGLALVIWANTVVGALFIAANAWIDRRPNLRELTYAATMVPASDEVSLTVANVSTARAMLVAWAAFAAVAGLALHLTSVLPGLRQWRAPRLARLAALPLIALGLLAQHGGAVGFFAALGIGVCLLLFMPEAGRWNRERKARRAAEADSSSTPAAAIAPLLALAGWAALALATPATARTTTPDDEFPWLETGAKSAQAIVQTWKLREDRLFAEVDFTVRGGPGDSFLLLRSPAILTEFKGDGLRLGKVERGDQLAYYVAPEREGLLTGRARFEMPVPDRSASLPLPTGPAATQRVTLELDQGGWEFSSAAAVQVRPTAGLGDDRSGATLVFAPLGVPVIERRPKRRDLTTEATQFFVETANLYVPGPGVVNGKTRVTVRPAQGRVHELELTVPAGLTVGNVGDGPISEWRFDPVQRRLRVSIEPAQTAVFSFDVDTQLGAGALPFDLALEPLRVGGAAGEVGLLALAFGGDAQPEAVRPTGLSPVNVQDFGTALLPSRDQRPLATLQHVWRFGQAGGRVDLKVAAVAPEVRVAGRQVFSLDDDRLVMAADLQVAITRVGLFKLSFALPEGLEVEALSGAALNQWTEAREGNRRVVTLHLNGRTLGEQAFTLTLAGPAPRAQDAWLVPRLAVREATRQTGEVLLVPGKGLRLRAVGRENVTQLDPRTAGGLQPGTLAFRLLQDNWALRIGIEALDPWTTVQALQEVTLREGQTLTRIGARCRVENAAVKTLRVRLPGLAEERARTVRATGTAVNDIVRVAGEPDLWELRFQRGIAGETDVQIEFQGLATRQGGLENIAPPEFIGARQTVQFVAVRSGGRLDLDAAPPPRGWTRVDWSAVPAGLQSRGDRSVPALCYRVAEPEGPIAVNVRRHDVAEALKLRVASADLTTLFSPAGPALTAVKLNVDVLEKSSLQVRLPEGARLFNTFVNGVSVSVVREGDAYRFHVAPNSDADRSASVRLVYQASGTGRSRIALAGPRLSVPLENVTWRVVIPPGFELADYAGSLRLREERWGALFGLDEYKSSVVSKRSEESNKAVAMLKEAGRLLQKGDQQKASEVLSRAASTAVLDEASNEDARVQLRNLKTQQTVLGLNTRRQRMYLDNRADTARNEQLEQAATLNPFMQGKFNYDPHQVDQLLMGNTVEENSALNGIAARLVDQQLGAEPAPGALDVTLPERGRVLTFGRRLQVDGSAALELRLSVNRTSGTNALTSGLVLALIAAIGAYHFYRRPGGSA